MSERHPSDELLSARLDEALDERESARVAEHLFSCAECTRRLELLRATSAAIASLPEEAPQRALDFTFTTRPRGAAGWLSRLLRPQVLAPFAAAAAALLLAVTLIPRMHAGPTESSTALRPTAGGQAFSSAPQTLDKNPPPINGNLAPGVAQAVPGTLTTGPGFAEEGDGLSLMLRVDPGRARRGDQVHVTLTLTGGNQDRQLSSFGVRVTTRRDGQEWPLGAMQGDFTLHAHQVVIYDYFWTAGATNGSPAPGGYSIVGRLAYAGTTQLAVDQPVSVS